MRNNSELGCTTVPNASSSIFWRSLFVGVISTIELFLASTVFQYAGKLNLPFETVWWIRALLQPDLLTRIFLTFCVAILLFCGRDLLHKIQSQPAYKSIRFADFWLIISNCFCMFGIIATSHYLDQFSLAKTLWPSFGISIWLTCFIGLIFTAAVSLQPFSMWLEFARDNKASFWVAVLVGVSAWGGGFFSLRLWKFLGPATFAVVELLLSMVGFKVVHGVDQYNIGIDSFSINIAAACSGYEGIGLMLSFISGYLWISRQRLKFPTSFLLLPLTITLIWLANSLRIAALIVIGAKGYPEVALGGFHSQAGWIAFNIVALATVYLCDSSPLFSKKHNYLSDDETIRQPNEAVPFLLPFLALLFVAMLTATLSSGFDWFYPARVIIAGGLLLKFRRSYPKFRFSSAAIATGILVFFVWALLEAEQTASGPPEDLLSLSQFARYSWLLFRVIGFCIVIPWAEELAFRGYLTRRLIVENVASIPIGSYTFVSLVVSSLLFGLMHGQWAGGIFAGAAYAIVLYYKKNLADAITAHAVTNTLLMCYAVCSNKWGIWI